MSSLSRNLPSVSLALCSSLLSIVHLYGCHGDSAPVEQIGQSNSDLPLFFHLLFDCLGNIPVLATDLSGNSKADVHLKNKCKLITSWMYVQFNFSKV